MPAREGFAWFGDWQEAFDSWARESPGLDPDDVLLTTLHAAHDGAENPAEIDAHTHNLYAASYHRDYPHLPPRPFNPACGCAACRDLTRDARTPHD